MSGMLPLIPILRQVSSRSPTATLLCTRRSEVYTCWPHRPRASNNQTTLDHPGRHYSTEPNDNLEEKGSRLTFDPARRYIVPAGKTNPGKLAKALEVFLTAEEVCGIGSQGNISLGEKKWYLDDRGDAIHRHVAFSSQAETDGSMSQIMHGANQMNHHPHICTTCVELSMPLWLTTITCTSHKPRGLSMRDVRLAGKVDEVLKDGGILPIEGFAGQPLHAHRIEDAKSRNLSANRAAIIQATSHQS